MFDFVAYDVFDVVVDDNDDNSNVAVVAVGLNLLLDRAVLP